MSKSSKSLKTLEQSEIYAVDPGLYQSAFFWLGKNGNFVDCRIKDNIDLTEPHMGFGRSDSVILAMELMSVPGKSANRDVFLTQFWAGRIAQNVLYCSADVRLIHVLRRDVVKHIVGGRGGDSEVRNAIIDRYGGKEKAIGRKPKNKKDPARPGPLYEIKRDMWSALAIALTVKENLQWVEESLSKSVLGPREAVLKLP